MELSFGARLRQQRERRQVSLAAIAEDTKIKLALLEGLERDDVSRWPAGIFRRSYVRAYAQAIGADVDSTVREFLELYPDPLREEPRETSEAANGRRPQTRLGWLLESATSVLASRCRAGAASGDGVGACVPPPAAAAPPSERDRAERGREVPPSPVLQAVEQVATNQPVDGVTVRAERRPLPRAAIQPRPLARAAARDRWPSARAATAGADLGAMADLCTRLGRARQAAELYSVLTDAMRLLRAVGLVVWAEEGSTLRPVLAHGYSTDVIAHLPDVGFDANTPVAAAFRSAETRVVTGSADATGALAVPILAPTGCAGVLAVELPGGEEQRESTRAFAAILAAQLSTLIAPSFEKAVSA